MKHRITYRLIGYFSAVLLLFSILIGILFWVLFSSHTAKIKEEELKERAISIANTLSQFSQREYRGHGMSGGYGAYLRFIDEIAMSEVWLADEKAKTIQMGYRGHSLSYQDLPAGAEALIQEVFKGNLVSNREFSILLDVPSITVGAPIYNIDGTIIAALLLHSPINGIQYAQRDGMMILIFCMFTALFFAFVLSILLARHFINPLEKIGYATEQAIKGDYSARTKVKQEDEIGFLACNIDELFVQLSEVEEKRKRLDKMRQDFISNISHELRTPVTIIKGSLEVLEEGLITDPNEIKEYFHQMLLDTTHLQRLVNDLLELSRLQNTNFQIDKTKINLTDIIKEAIRSMQRIAEQKQVKIELENNIGNISFLGDYGRLRQMFIIILDNAIKFSLANNKVVVKMEEKENQFVISILDYGGGILPEDIPFLFERFYKERSEQNKGGSGLGLPIAKQIADRHNILIKCESNAKDYTKFSFLILS